MSNKRALAPTFSSSSTSIAPPPTKRANTTTKPSGSLSSWIVSTSPSKKPLLPSPIVSSPPLTDRKSTFIAHATPLTSLTQVNLFHSHIRSLRNVATHPKAADHEMLGYRIMALKFGKNGLNGEDDWNVKLDGDDDGEKGGARTIQSCLEKRGEIDVAVVVSRWYGGIMLGPDRFRHIQLVTNQALTALAQTMAVEPLIERLKSLDQEINLITWTSLTSSPIKSSPIKEQDYTLLQDENKIERLIAAREKKLELLKKKRKAEEDEMKDELEKFVKDQGESLEWDSDPGTCTLREEVHEEEDWGDMPPLPDLSDDEDEEAVRAAAEAR